MRLPKLLALTLSLSFVFVSFPYAARADLPPPNAAGCSEKRAGNGCTRSGGGVGICVASKCSKRDYSCQTDAGHGCGVEYDCLLCQPSAGRDSGLVPDDSTDAGTTDGNVPDGCAIAARPSSALAFPLAVAVLAVVGLARRKRRARPERDGSSS